MLTSCNANRVRGESEWMKGHKRSSGLVLLGAAHLLLSVLALLALLARALGALVEASLQQGAQIISRPGTMCRGSTNTLQAVLGLVLLQGINAVVDQCESDSLRDGTCQLHAVRNYSSSNLATSEGNLEAVRNDDFRCGLEGLGQQLGQLGAGDRGAVGVDDLKNLQSRLTI